MPTYLWQEIRRVEAGSVDIVADGTPNSMDVDISITQGEEDALEFDVVIKNLAESSWSGIQEGDPCRVSLGWLETSAPPVCLGIIESAYTKPDGADLDFIIKGRDESDRRLDIHLSKSWEPTTADQIAADIGREVGLAPGRIDSAGEPFEEIYSISHERPTRYWLDELADEAEEKTGSQFEWFTDTGQLNFIRKDTTLEQATVISNQGPRNLIDISRASGRSEDSDGEELEFEAVCLPEIKRASLVQVATERFGGTYQVRQYSHDSSTVSERHSTTGTIVSVDSQYEAVRPNITLGNRWGVR